MRDRIIVAGIAFALGVTPLCPAEPGASGIRVKDGAANQRQPAPTPANQGVDCYPATYDPATKRVTMTDTCAKTPRVIMQPSFGTDPVWQEGVGTATTALEPAITFIDMDGGFDLVLDFDNQTGQVRSPGEIVIDGIRFGEDVTLRDFRITDVDDPDLNPGPGFGPFDDYEFGESLAGLAVKTAYPVNWFSPAFVISDSTYTLGVSVEYPVLAYQHNLRFSVVSEALPDQFGRAWKIRIRLNAHNQTGSGGAQFRQAGELNPGEQASYRVCVRVIKDDPAWATTLLPYRAYFQNTYGIPNYGFERDPRPVRAEFLARTGSITECCGDLGYFDNNPEKPNPYFEMFMNPRTPGVGWTAWRDNLRDVTKEVGYERVLVWTMSGRFTLGFPCESNAIYNFPFIFASNLPLIGVDEPNIGDDFTMLSAIEEGGVEFGMYWGRAAQPMAPITNLDDWNCPFDPGPPASGMVFTDDTINLTSQADLDLAYGEFDTALMAGPSWVGLDAVSRLDPWDRLDYAADLKSRAVNEGQADFRITLEPFRGDITIIDFPGMNTGNRLMLGPNGEQPDFMTLCDFLAPGHEIYGITSGTPLPGDVGDDKVGATEQYRRNLAMRLASAGFIPVITPTNAEITEDPLNDGSIDPKPPVIIAIPDPDNPKGPPVTDPQFIAKRTWQTNAALPDDPEIRRLGDVDLDGDCDMDDLMLLNTNMGRVAKYDLTGDGVVDMDDVVIVMTYLGAY
ncbi:MAG: hypothetical protein RLN60_01935 [Phycisphaerales bacterium]